MNPGYIRGYGPGIRENGGQYTHAAIWAIMAFAALRTTGKDSAAAENDPPREPYGLDAGATDRYKVEPYVMAADVYANKAHQGMGGWTWYTGSAGWMYQLILHSLLGLQRTAGRLTIRPCLPPDWPSVHLAYRFGAAEYRITIFQLSDDSPSRWTIDDLEGDGRHDRANGRRTAA